MIGVQEICVNGREYIRFRNNAVMLSTISLSYTFGADTGSPGIDSHHLELSPGKVSSSIYVPVVHCDGVTARRFRVNFFAQ